jgi:CxxC-x17-CxxC domain-containing protein
LPPPVALENSSREKIIKASRERYGVKREIVDDKISRWSGFGPEDDLSNPPVPQKFPAAQSRVNKPQGVQTFQKDNFSQGRIQADGQTVLYDAVCSNCGKPTKVVFPPEKGRAVYCKSCLKKLHPDKPADVGANKIKPKEDIKSVSPSRPPDSISPAAENWKVENISFHNPKNKPEDRKKDRPKRKEIDLAELRKALEESLEKKGEIENPHPENDENADEPFENTAAGKPSQNQNELQKKIEQEKELDKMTEEENAVEPGPLPENKAIEDKKIIKPGETVKL